MLDSPRIVVYSAQPHPHSHRRGPQLTGGSIHVTAVRQVNNIAPGIDVATRQTVLDTYYNTAAQVIISPGSHRRPFLGRHRANTLTTPSPPPLTTHLPSWLQTHQQTPSPRITRWLVISCVQDRFSRLQNRSDASWPALRSSRPSGLSDRLEMASGCASMLYVHCPRPGQCHARPLVDHTYRCWRRRIARTDPRGPR